MTMFRRVFSNHFDGQGPDAEPPRYRAADRELPPAPPAGPPKLKPHEKSPLTEMAQTRQTGAKSVTEGAALRPEAPAHMPTPQQRDADLAARAAEIHAQMIKSGPTIALRSSTDATSLTAPSQPSAREAAQPEAATAPQPVVQPAAQSRPRSGRARTRLLGFDTGGEVAADPIAATQSAAPADRQINPAGWVVIVKGPGAGHHFALFGGVAMVGRGEDQGIRLDFGDQTVSRQNHAALAYDAEDNKFYLGHGGKSNIIKLNGRPVLSTEEIFDGDMIRIGETTLRMVALCGEEFQWGREEDA